MATASVQFRMHADLHAALSELASARKQSMNDVLREALAIYTDDIPPPAKPIPPPVEPDSINDRSGTVTLGPEQGVPPQHSYGLTVEQRRRLGIS